MNVLGKLILSGGLSAMALTAPAGAAVIEITHTGTVVQGIDTDGLFGSSGADLTGLDYTVLSPSIPASWMIR